jgi:peptidoglycan hydrolase-like protein with peptidoglycan-binding domain
MSTGKHLHWELRHGKSHIWDANGKNYIEPIGFFKALIAKEKAIASAAVVATENDPVEDAPEHNEAQAAKVDAALKAKKTTPEVAAPEAAPKMANPGSPGHYLRKGSTSEHVKFIQQQLNLKVDGIFGDKTHVAIESLQRKHGLLVDGIVGPKTWAFLD